MYVHACTCAFIVPVHVGAYIVNIGTFEQNSLFPIHTDRPQRMWVGG